MVSNLPSSPSTALLITQGIQAIKSGDPVHAYTLLTQALAADPRDEQAWLWLSGAVAGAGERRYCLEQVLAINPHNTGAQRGLALLPSSVAAISPLPAVSPAPDVPDTRLEGIFSGTTTKLALPDAPQAAAAPTLQPVVLTPVEPPPLQLPSLWSTPATSSQTQASAPPAVSAVSAASDAPAASAYKQADIDFVIKGFGKHYSHEQIARILSEQQGYNWDEAHAIIAHVATAYSTKVAARQLPLYLVLGVVTLITGIGMAGRSGMALYFYYQHPILFNPRLFLVFGTGVLMTLGSAIGTAQCVRSVWKK